MFFCQQMKLRLLRRVLQIALLPSKADFIHLEGLCGATKST